MNGFRLITLDTNENVAAGSVGKISQTQLDWLAEQLETERPVIVFSHHSLVRTPKGKGWITNLYQAEKLMSVLEKNGNVVAMFSGHRAVNYTTEVNGISYVIINNLADKKALGSFATIDIDKNEENEISVHIEQFGKRPTSYDFSKTMPLKLKIKL
jgi:alkaline phosphatase